MEWAASLRRDAFAEHVDVEGRGHVQVGHDLRASPAQCCAHVPPALVARGRITRSEDLSRHAPYRAPVKPGMDSVGVASAPPLHGPVPVTRSTVEPAVSAARPGWRPA